MRFVFGMSDVWGLSCVHNVGTMMRLYIAVV